MDTQNPDEIVYIPTSGDIKSPIILSKNEWEALRISKYDSDIDGSRMKQTNAAQIMGISQPTFSRLLENAIKKIVAGIAENRSLKINK